LARILLFLFIIYGTYYFYIKYSEKTKRELAQKRVTEYRDSFGEDNGRDLGKALYKVRSVRSKMKNEGQNQENAENKPENNEANQGVEPPNNDEPRNYENRDNLNSLKKEEASTPKSINRAARSVQPANIERDANEDEQDQEQYQPQEDDDEDSVAVAKAQRAKLMKNFLERIKKKNQAKEKNTIAPDGSSDSESEQENEE
jgi:hypothetical protein